MCPDHSEHCNVLCKLAVNLDKGVKKARHVTFLLVLFFEVCSIKFYLHAKRHESCVQVTGDRLIQGVQKVAVLGSFNSRSI
jgi:hypothetical protein